MKTSLLRLIAILLLVAYNAGCTNPTACDVQAEDKETKATAEESADSSEASSGNEEVMSELKVIRDMVANTESNVSKLSERVGKVEGRLDNLEQRFNQSPVQYHTSLLTDEGEFLKQFKANSDLNLELRGFSPDDLAFRQAIFDGQNRLQQDVGNTVENLRPVIRDEIRAFFADQSQTENTPTDSATTSPELPPAKAEGDPVDSTGQTPE